jgi:hypothetical protein
VVGVGRQFASPFQNLVFAYCTISAGANGKMMDYAGSLENSKR